MQLGVLFRVCVLWGLVVLTSTLTKTVKKKGTGRRSRQVFGAELPEGAWSQWGEWSGCSQSCGVGVAQRTRKCLPPPARQTPPLSHAPPNWGTSFLPSSSLFTPGGGGAPLISASHPYYPPRYPGNQLAQHGGGAEPERQLPPYYSPVLSANQSPGLPLYRDTPAEGGEGAVSNPGPSFYRTEFSAAANQEQPPVSVYRSPLYPAAPHGFSQPTRTSRRPANPSPARGSGGSNRRSVSTNREALPARRSSSIRPGQFGYGRVPFSLPLHRPHRQARHTANGTVTTATPGPDTAAGGTSEEEVERGGAKKEKEGRTRGEDEGREEEERREEERREEEGREEERREEERNTEEDAGTESPAPGPTVATAKTVKPDRQTGRPDRQTGSPDRQTGSPDRQTGRPDRQTGRPDRQTGRPDRQAGRALDTHTESGRGQPHSRPPPPGRRAFNWNTVTAPPPPLHPHSPPLSHPYYPSPLHREREPQSVYSPQAPPPHARAPQPNIYPLQRTQPPHLGPEGEGGSAQSYRCSGDETEHRKCFTQVCGGGLDPRAEQCAAFNTQEFMGRLYDWEPFTEVGLDKQCVLTCRPVGYRFYVRQAETVRDGTPCINNTSHVCLAGRCLSEGCDGVLGSARVIDRCGVCGGLDSSCRKVSGIFQNSTVPLGYYKILDIPVGATAINITEKRASSNYLAMRSGTGASVVNGRWAVDPPGEYQAGGTTFTYTRPRAQGEGQEERGESLTAPGPTTTILQLYIIFHKQNPGIDYEFYVPVENREAERELSVARDRELSVGRERSREWAGELDRPRDGGRAPLRGTSALTVSVEDPLLPPPIFVASSSSSSSSSERWTPEQPRPRVAAPNRNARIPPRTDLPPDTQPPFVWRRGSFTDCSASCGKGSRHRLILCINRHTEEEVADRKCDSAARPSLEEEACNTQPCPPFWEASSWSECSVSCGEGVQQRQLQCRQSFGNRSTMVHPQRCALLPPPDSTQTCQLQLCSHWEASPTWSTCSVDCGLGKRTRSVRCVSDHGNVVNDKECSPRLRPQGSEDCHMGPCVTNWYFTDWSNTCSAQCGPGVQRREVLCLTRGGGREGGGGGDCVGDKPADMKACNGGPCVHTHLWFSSPWTQCSVPCGSGNQRRDVICVQKLGTDFSVTPASECAHLEKPPSVQECEGGPCRPRWFSTEWSTCSRSCGKGLQVREVRCLTADKQHSQDCDSAPRPEQEQFCNTIPCGPLVTDENCRDRRHNCVMVVQARLCVYSYYKTACCASCTQSAQRAKRH